MTRIFFSSHSASFSTASVAMLAGLCLHQTAWADNAQPANKQTTNAQVLAKSTIMPALKQKAPYSNSTPHSPDWGVFNTGKGVASGFGIIGGLGSPVGRKTGVTWQPCPQQKGVQTGLTV